MKADELLKAIGGIDPDYIEEAEEVRKTRKNYKAVVGIAACLGLMVAAGSLMMNPEKGGYESTASTSKQETAESEEGKVPEKETMQMEGESAASKIPERIYVGADCYTRTTESAVNQKESFTFIGVLGEESDSIHADNGRTGDEIYRIDANKIAIKRDGKKIVYRK